ncbi:hypothetical protein EVAR_73885_1 [Eumeta japonica]|uniref:Uncharacterized protein n=1 Tax=Eumeta variegata TaxID=151549 RepID=A0A4C1TK28_EUMVA|nr:hypothetical protein EVAR_73885_1 [Eumeta japonica]
MLAQDYLGPRDCLPGLLFEPYPMVIMSVQWGWWLRVISKEKLRQPWLRCLFGCNMVICDEVVEKHSTGSLWRSENLYVYQAIK